MLRFDHAMAKRARRYSQLIPISYLTMPPYAAGSLYTCNYYNIEPYGALGKYIPVGSSGNWDTPVGWPKPASQLAYTLPEATAPTVAYGFKSMTGKRSTVSGSYILYLVAVSEPISQTRGPHRQTLVHTVPAFISYLATPQHALPSPGYPTFPRAPLAVLLHNVHPLCGG